MNGPSLFNAVAHGTTLYYYVHVLRTIAAIKAAPSDPTIVHDFVDFKPKYFTMWGVFVQTMLFASCVLHDATRVLSPGNAVRRGARGLRDVILVGAAAPAAVTVSAMFWSLFYLDRDLVMPPALDAVVPSWLNHAMHTFVVVLAVVQMLSESHQAPPAGLTMGLGGAFIVAYVYTLFNEYAATGRWLYPVFAVLGWPGRVALVTFTSAMFLALGMLVRVIVKARWGSPAKTSTKKRL